MIHSVIREQIVSQVHVLVTVNHSFPGHNGTIPWVLTEFGYSDLTDMDRDDKLTN